MSPTQIQYAPDGAAWKRPSMVGYVKKVVAANGDPETDYDLVFVKSDGTAHPFAFGASQTVSSSTLGLTRALLGHILAEDWQQSTAALYETARTGGDGEW